jgi:hypothetical protein
VYHANGGIVGELAYVVGKLRGTAHCALCDITHGAVRMKPAFAALQQRCPVPVRLVHLNERPPELAKVSRGRTPCVVGESRVGGRAVWRELLAPDDLERCAGSVEAFETALGAALVAPDG